MNILKIFFKFYIILIFLLNTIYSQNQKDWTCAIYMEAGTQNMSYWVNKNINDMAAAKFDNKNLNILTQVHITGDIVTRYNIFDGQIKQIETLKFNQQPEQNIIDFMQWIKNNYPAKHYALITSGHGFGILDPKYQPTSTDEFAWDIEPDEPEFVCTDGICPIKSFNNNLISENLNHANHRGFMFNGFKTFINNAQMIYMLKTIKEKVLDNNKLDILGTDCCKMSMLEIGYQIKDYVNYLVGSQNCELIDGWNYKDLFSCFNKDNITPIDALSFITKTYSDYYQKNTKESIYTISAIDLSKIGKLVDNFNDIIVTSKNLMLNHKQEFIKLIFGARENTPNMCSSSYYRDLGSLYLNMLEEISKRESAGLCSQCAKDLKKYLITGLELIKDAVIFNVTGTAVANMHGLAFYFPRNRIDASYLDTVFVKDTEWLNFLQNIIS